MEDYIKFMLEGTGHETVVEEGNTSFSSSNMVMPLSPAANTNITSPAATDESRRIRQTMSRFNGLKSRFVALVEHEWMFQDSELERIIQSLQNVSVRIRQEELLLAELREEEDDIDDDQEWKNFGFHAASGGGGGGGLNLDDVTVAYNHDILRREKLLGLVRKFIGQLNEAQLSVSRHVDEIMQFSMSIDDAFVSKKYSENTIVEEFISLSVQLFKELSRELYRKQRLVEEIMDCFLKDEERVSKICNCWSAYSKHSKIDKTKLDWVKNNSSSNPKHDNNSNNIGS